MRPRKLLVSGFLTAATFFALASEAEARPTIKNPGDHPEYRAELEPHANFILWHGNYYGGRYHQYRGVGDAEVGAGFRATIELGDPAFIPKINNTVGITFGIDLTNCRYCGRYDYSVWTPIGMQWNFFFTDKWSAFGDVGFMLRSGGFYGDVNPDFFLMAGGRYHINDKVALTLRLGSPFVSFGVSFFVGS